MTCDHLVTYYRPVTDDDRVFKALADPTRRLLLDRLFERDGRTLTELESELEMTRFGVMKHLRVLEDAGLVVTRRSGREKLHFLNPVPIRLIHDRWIDKYTERQRLGARRPQDRAGGERHDHHDGARPRRSTSSFIKATPEQIWEAITKPEFTRRYFFGARHRASTPDRYLLARPRRRACGATATVEEFDPPRRLVHGWQLAVRRRAGRRGARAA